MKKGLKHFRENEKLENLYNIIYDIDTKDNIRLVHRRQEMPLSCSFTAFFYKKTRLIMLQHHEPLAINLYTANAKAVRIVAIYVVYQSICLGNYRLRCRYGDSNVYII